MEGGIRPCFMQGVGIFDRTGHVEASVDDCSWNTAETMGITKKLAILHPATMDEIVIFQPGKREREVPIAKGCRDGLVGQERDRFTFPKCPSLGCLDLRGPVLACKQPPIGGNHVTSFALRYGCLELFPFFRK